MKQNERNTRQLAAIVQSMIRWYLKNARDLPWRREPFRGDPYAVYVSEIMLQQTQVKTVIPFWERWMRELPTLQAAAAASSDKIHKLWEALWYYARVRNLQKAAQVMVARHGGQFPNKFGDVFALPGIGRYTAGAICSIAFNQPVAILDGNVIRVLARVFGIAENPKEKTTNARLWLLAEALVNQASEAGRRRPRACSHLNQSLMELGALVCSPRKPQCRVCPVKKFCVAFKESRTEALPLSGERETATARYFTAFAIERAGKFLVRQRPAGVVNAHLWEFPNAETDEPRTVASDLFQSLFGFSAPRLSPLCTIKHSITRYRITLEAYILSLKEIPGKVEGAWATPAQMPRLAFTAAHKKLASAAAKSILSGR